MFGPVALTAFVTSSEMISSASSMTSVAPHQRKVHLVKVRAQHAAVGTAASVNRSQARSRDMPLPLVCRREVVLGRAGREHVDVCLKAVLQAVEQRVLKHVARGQMA